jgi:hypothetical protein
MQPKAIDAVQAFGYEIRTLAHQLLDAALTADMKPGYYALMVDSVMTHPRSREVIDCITALAVSSYREYYCGDDEATGWCIEREMFVAEFLADAEARLFGESYAERVTRSMAKVRMLVNVEGMFENHHGGVKRGDVVEVSDATVQRYCERGYCQTDLKGELLPPYHPAA